MSKNDMMISLMRKSSSELPLWARVLFETPELIGEKLEDFKTWMIKAGVGS